MSDLHLLRRAEDLQRRSSEQNIVTHTGFLSPTEQHAIQTLPHLRQGLFFHGGGADCERRIAFFLPDYLTPEDFDPAEYITAFRIRCRFGAPGHRDVLGSLLGLGLERWTLGDIHAAGETARFYCLPSIAAHIARELTHIGRNGVQVTEIPPGEMPVPERQRETIAFTVSSLRLDAVLAGTFNLSRTAAAAHIAAGLVQVNYTPCLKPAAELTPGDVFSLRGSGKAMLAEVGGKSRKDRTRIRVERYL
ncbi:MAG: YlmH/Sll1252 family protein [Oscillospiraceae bacterium]|nr:YlmH/Sll1252 family protein [Oscillospiraceae bacterium]